MDFINLQTILDGIAASSKPLSHQREKTKFPGSESYAEFWERAYPEMDEEHRLSDAAIALNKALQQSKNPPKWWAHDEEQGFHIENSSAALEGKELLKKASNLSARNQEERYQFIKDCMARDWNPIEVGMGRDIENIWPARGSAFRVYEIGFERGELIDFLVRNGIEHSIYLVVDSDSLSTSVTAPSIAQAQAEDWVVKSVALANEIGGRKWAQKEYGITARNICNAVATELAKGEPGEPQKYHGSQGPRSAGSIRNIALKGWKFIHPTGTSGKNGMDEKIA